MATLKLNARQLIENANKNIEKNIDVLCPEYLGLCAQNILSQTRNLIDGIALYQYSIDNPLFNNVNNGREYINKAKNNLFAQHKAFGVVKELYDYLEIVASHYTQTEFNSIGLIKEYSNLLISLKKVVFQEYDISILNNINNFPFDFRDDQKNYYDLVYSKISENYSFEDAPKNTYYIEKKKAILLSNNRIMYEIVLSPANDRRTKFDRLTAYTKEDIIDRHSVVCRIIEVNVGQLNGIPLSACYISDILISIRPCELNRFAELECFQLKIDRKAAGYSPLMNILTIERMSLYDFVMNSGFEDRIKEIENGKENSISKFLKYTKRKLIDKGNISGQKTLTYLFYILRHDILKSQKYTDVDKKIQGTNLSTGCYPFEKNPFSMSLINHNPTLSDLLYCLHPYCTMEDMFHRKIIENCEENRKLYSSIDKLNEIYQANELVKAYNKKLDSRYDGSKLLMVDEEKYITIKDYEEDAKFVINYLKEKSTIKDGEYQLTAEKYLNSHPEIEIDDDKKKILKTAFVSSAALVVKGSAGTGKTTIVKYLSEILQKYSVLYVSFTHSAVQNLKRRVGNFGNQKRNFVTAETATRENYSISSYEILVVDECSMLPNATMKRILSKRNFKKVILVGDDQQIESIKFGTWFKVLNGVIPSICHELSITHRTEDHDIKMIWELTRKRESNLCEKLKNAGYVEPLSDAIFKKIDEDEIILCLNYDGLFGINRINKYMQFNNEKDSVSWKVWTFKEGDKILFNESYLFKDFFYNNQKGTISNIEESDDFVVFEVDVEKEANSNRGFNSFVQFVKENENGTLTYRITIYKDDDNDENESNNRAIVVPFQLAYAVTIHKSQGLEYNSVKIILTKEIEESVSFNVFYTAITRAKKHLSIYCDEGSLEKIVKSFEKDDDELELELFKKRLDN